MTSRSQSDTAACMHAMMMRALGEPDALQWTELPTPEPGPGQVRIAVEAIGCNFADTLICRGGYQIKPQLPFAPGSEVSGRIVALGPGVSGLSVGQSVMALLAFGGYATEVVADAQRVFAMREGMSFAHAAALGVAYQTSYLALCDRAQLRAGETLLVHAAAGGVGLAAVQIGRALGARVIAGAGSPDKCELALQQGAHEAVDTRADDWRARVLALTDGRGADVIYDSVGGRVFDESTRCIAWGGRLLVIGFSSGEIPSVKCNRIMLKHIAVIGLHLHGYHEHAPDKLRDAMQALFALYDRGVQPLVSREFPLREAPAALALLAARGTSGKVVLRVE